MADFRPTQQYLFRVYQRFCARLGALAVGSFQRRLPGL